MRFVSGVVLALALCGAAFAQTAQKKAPPPPAKDPVAASYAAMSEANRKSIQTDLVWTGDYNGNVDGQFGTRAIEAVKAFQKRNGTKQTGVLNPQERGRLAIAARREREAVGWRLIDDQASHARLGIPTKLAPDQSATARGTRWADAENQVVVETFRVAAPDTTLQAVYEEQRKAGGRKIPYGVIRPDFFVISGTEGDKKLYMRGEGKDGEVRGFSIQYPPSMAETVDRVAVAMASAFQGFPSGPQIAAMPPPRRKVEYGSGVFVSTQGHAITTRDLIDGCQSFVLAGHGPADLVAEDKQTGLALLRIYGVRDLKAVPLAESAAGSAVTLIGVADPQQQSGGGDISVMKANLASSARSASPVIEPAPGLGFAGAAVVDGSGRLAGIADVRIQLVAGSPAAVPAQATLIAAEAIKKFLTANKAQAMGAGGDAKAGVVRVICVRK